LCFRGVKEGGGGDVALAKGKIRYFSRKKFPLREGTRGNWCVVLDEELDANILK
jgi:hypothetical protein